VQDELLDRRAPLAVQTWIKNPPSWLEVRTPGRIDPRLDPSLDAGEREAITLVQHTYGHPILLMDEWPARIEAKRLGLKVTGTLAVLFAAHEEHLLNFSDAVTLLRTTTFKASDTLIQSFLNRV
jgi:predicted nucleic acid-binding protein